MSLANHHFLFKFNAQKPFFKNIKQRSFSSIEEYEKANVPEESFCCIFAKKPDCLTVRNAFLCECNSYGPDYGITFIKRQNNIIQIVFLNQIIHKEIEGISLALVCTDDKLYKDMLFKAIEHYSTVPDIKEICLAYFSDSDENFFPYFTTGFRKYPRNAFSMDFARNQAIKLCTQDAILITDLDCYFTNEDISFLKEVLTTTPNDGVLSIQYSEKPNDFSNINKFYRTGNGIAFGYRDVILENLYDERFQKVFHEDTEWLMNFSRMGIIPEYVFMNYQYDKHPRTLTSPYSSTNKGLFEKILKYGR